MKLKSKSIATKLLLASSLSAVVIVLAIVSFIKFSMIPRLTDKALENQTSALAHSLKGIQGNPEQWTKEILALEDVLDPFSNEGQKVATLFILENGKFIRAATTLKRDDGRRAIGSALDPESEAARALTAGKEYSGPITLFGRLHMATYLPVAFDNGLRGAVFVGIDYNSADPMLALAKQMDYIVIGVGIFAVVLLGVGLVFSIRVEEAHRETQDIFRTTQEGLFLLDHELRMGTQTSHSLERVLGFEVKPGDNFLERLKPLVTPKTYDTAKEYIELLLRHDVKEKLVASLNPLDCIEIAGVRPNGGVESRFLQIRFNRVMKSGKVTHLLVTANDISRQVRLERELRESEKRVQDQMGMMVHILQAEPRLLQDFLGNATSSLNQINEDLRTSNTRNAATGISTDQLDAMLRSAHQLKGDASAMQLEAVTQSLHAFETLVQDLRGQTKRKGEDLLPVTVKVKELYGEIRAIQDVIARISQVRGVVSVEPPRPEATSRNSEEIAQQAFVRQWNGFAHQIAARHEKKVDLVYQGLDLETLAPPLRDALNTVINQFIRNALVHGVETPAERKLRGKSEAAHLSLYVSDQGDGTVELSFRDDGRGIDPERIREAVVRAGRYTAEEAAALSPRQLTLMIFEPGFSTRSTADEDAGRGIGLDAVREQITRLGGRIRIGTTRGEYCHFRVQLPMRKEPGAKATGPAPANEAIREAA